VNDNLLPLVSQIVLDSYFDPEYLSLPRAQLLFHDPKSSLAAIHKIPAGELPHMELMEQDLLPDKFTLKSLDNVCFRRVIYGTGSRLIYHHVLRRLRFESSQFLHLLVKEKYCQYAQDISITNVAKESPSDMFVPDSRIVDRLCHDKHSTSRSASQSKKKIIIYSRGTSGKGRTLGNEAMLQTKLQALGYETEISRGSHSMMQQLEQVLSADILIGLHGAGLTNAIFAKEGIYLIELKGHYGFDLDLFAIVTEARRGRYLQLDIRSYATKGNGQSSGGGGCGMIDSALIKRVIEGIALLTNTSDVQQQSSSNTTTAKDQIRGKMKSMKVVSEPAQQVQVLNLSPLDLAIFPENVEKGLIPKAIEVKQSVSNDLFGPSLQNLGIACNDLIYLEYWRLLGTKYKDRHCQGCHRSK
jgi:hypothetical protein